MTAFTEITAPTTPVVSVDDAKAFLRVDHVDEDVLITALVDAAAGYLDGPHGILGRALVSQAWRLSWACAPDGNSLELPLVPLVTVEAIKTIVDGVEAVFDSSNYTVTAAGDLAMITLKDGVSWPDADDLPDAFRVEATFGYLTAADVPPQINVAVKMLLSHFYENRGVILTGGGVSMPISVDALIAPFRRFVL